VLSEYQKVLQAELTKIGDKEMTETEVNALFSKCITQYNVQVHSPNYQNWETTFATLQLLKEELKQEKDKKALVIRNSHKKAGMRLGLAFMGATA